MKSKVFNAYNKYMILKHALKVKNISETCEIFEISRTTFYNWNRAYQKHGMSGLEVKDAKKPKMPNKVSRSIETEILNHVKRCPADGPKRIFYELKAEGIEVGETGIYNVLKRNNLSKKAERVEYSKNKSVLVRERQRSKKLIPSLEFTKETYAGYVVIQKIDLIGSFDGIGKIYQYSIYDTYSNFGFVKIYNRKQDIDPWYYFELKLVYLMEIFDMGIENLITEKSKEFVSYFVKGDRYKEILEYFNINHKFINIEKNTILDSISRFNEFLIKEFYNEIRNNTELDSFQKVEDELHKFLRNYNFSRKISSGVHRGKVPAQIVVERAVQNNIDLDKLPLWVLTLISPFKELKNN